MPKISVIVPVYKVEKYLEKCIDSILAQTFTDFELWLVDDGSPDNCGAICDTYAQKDSRVKVIHKENGGLSDARNAGIDIASGAWYLFVDSDDTITPDTIERLYKAATTYDCEIAVCNILRIYNDGATEPFYAPVSELTLWDNQQRFETLKQPSVCNKLFRADLFRGIRFPKEKYYEDTFIYHILAHRARRIVLTGHNGYYYLSRRESILGHPRYTDRYFDMVEALYNRMAYLMTHQVSHYSEEACLSMYAAVADAEKHIKKTVDNVDKFIQMRSWYQIAYSHLIKHPNTGAKQKLRLILLRYSPVLHSMFYYMKSS